jgi:hypothetical protein
MELTIHIEGITPLLMHSPLGMKSSGEAPNINRKNIPTPEEEAEAATYRLPSGQFYLPGEAFRACLAGGAKGQKIGKAFATNLVKGTVFMLSDTVPLYDPTTGEALTEYEIDMRRARVQKQGIVRARPKLAKWGAAPTFDYDHTAISAEHIKTLFALGGERVGVGDYRPECSGPFGRFHLTDA